MTEFTVLPGESSLQGELLYRTHEYSFEFVPASREDVRKRAGASGTTSLCIGTLQLEVGIQTGGVLFVWGYHPRNTWKEDKLDPPAFINGALRLEGPNSSSLQPGVTVDIGGNAAWTTACDLRSGWVHVRQANGASKAVRLVEFATSCVAELLDKQLVGLWLHPQFRPGLMK